MLNNKQPAVKCKWVQLSYLHKIVPVRMPGRLFIMPRDSAPCISRPLSRPEGPASAPPLPMPRRQQQDLDAAKTTTGLRLRLHGQTHDKRATHQTRDALETVATVSSLLQHRDRAKPRKNHSLVPSQAPRPRKTPEKMQSRPISSTETAQTPEKPQSRPI